MPLLDAPPPPLYRARGPMPGDAARERMGAITIAPTDLCRECRTEEEGKGGCPAIDQPPITGD